MITQVYSSPESSSAPSSEGNDDDDKNGSGSQDEVPQNDSEGTADSDDIGSSSDNGVDDNDGSNGGVAEGGGDPLKGLNVGTSKKCPPVPVSEGTVIENPFEEGKPCPTTAKGIDKRNTTTPTDELMINQTGLINNNVTGTESENITGRETGG